MLQEQIRLSYPWIKVKSHTRELLYRLGLAEDQEEAEMFLFRLHVENAQDLDFFGSDDRERIKGFLRFLIEDTQHHKELITEMKDEIQAIAEVQDGS